MSPSEKKEKEKLPVHPNLSEIQARIDIALAKRAAIVDSWVSKYDTSRCAPDKTEAELKAWDEELYNPPPANLGLGAEIPKEYLDGDGNRMMNAGNGKLRTLMLAGQKIGKKRDEREKEESRKRAKAESSDEEEGRASLVKSKKAKYKKSEEDESEKPVKVEKINKALLAMQKQEEEERKRGEDNPWKNAPKPLSSLAKKKKEKKKSKHAELLTELASTSVVQKTTFATAVTPAESTPKKESPLPIRIINLPTSSSAPPSLGAPLNAAALALSVSASDTASTSTPSIASSGSPSRSMGVELTEEERKRKERLKEKKRKQKEAKKKKKAEALVAAKAVGADAEMKDA